MRSVFFSGIAVLALMLTVQSAAAQRIKVKTRPGKPVVVSNLGSYNPRSCRASAPPTIRIAKQPQHGTLKHFVKSLRIENKGHCQGRTIKAVVVTYTPDAGFRGKDGGRVSYKTNRYSSGAAPRFQAHTFEVTVE